MQTHNQSAIRRTATILLSACLLHLVSILRVQAQRPGSEPSFPLLDNAMCDVSWYGNVPFFRRSEYGDRVTISKRLFTPLYWMRARSGTFLIACQIDTQEYDTLSLQMGVPDNIAGSPVGTVTIYQGGNTLVEFRNIVKGDLIEYTVDLLNSDFGNPADVSIEYSCGDAGAHFCSMYITEAELTPINYIPVDRGQI